MTITACHCGERQNVHHAGEGGCDERGVAYYHSRGECRVVDGRPLRERLFGAIGRWFTRAAGRPKNAPRA